MFAKCKAKLIYASNHKIEKTLKGYEGCLMANEDERASFVVNGDETAFFHTSPVKKVTVFGRFVKVKTENSLYCFEALRK